MYFALNSQSGLEECGFDDLNYISCGGAPLPVETVKTFEKKTGDLLVMDAIGYAASKGTVITLTKDLAVKLAPFNVHVNAIAPGFFPTKMAKAILDYSGERILERTQAGRFGSDVDMKGPALFLASDASNYVYGHVLVVDGGTTASVQ
jgi:NAD(P)-dependent dehydrogenase (short-subunit alcohol dehydrogenase family)